MKNLIRSSKNGGLSLKPGKRPKPDKRWTLLFIGNHGRTITLRRFKGMVLLTCLVLCISIAITVGLLYLSLNIRHDKNQLESDLQDLKEQIKALRHEKDVLMTRLVLTESRSAAKPAKKAQTQNESVVPQQNTSRHEETEPANQIAKIQEKVPVKKVPEAPVADDQADPGLSVAVEDFKVYPEVDENLLRVQFKIKNTSPNSQRVAGHAIVVLKGGQNGQNKYLAIPRISLSAGKPTGRQRGYSFGINHFKTMRFKTNLPKSPEIYQNATVFIFSGKGNLLLEHDFQVKLPPTRPATASKPPFRTPSTSDPTSSARSFGGGPPATTPTKPSTTTNARQPSTPTATPLSPDDLMNTLKNSTNE
jgi:hypothetical protein